MVITTYAWKCVNKSHYVLDMSTPFILLRFISRKMSKQTTTNKKDNENSLNLNFFVLSLHMSYEYVIRKVRTSSKVQHYDGG